MKRLKQLGIIMLILIIGGCGMNHNPDQKDQRAAANNWPDTLAFTDEFTRGFMDSTEEVQDGYYLFKSKTNGYTMLFPVNGKISDMSYEKTEDYDESFIFGSNEKGNISYEYQISYENSPITENIDANLDLLSIMASYQGEYETFEHEDKTYYFAKNSDKTKKGKYYSFFSYIKSKENEKAIMFYSRSFCTNSNQKCAASSPEVEDKLLMLMKSVNF
ncbi:hypothetical protein CU633_20475 [Bacillus sp. V3-13]|uniref:hypothetical protein n=1 Tax=Bacillus sp. V3-13 TaxID=2053728 RepID=UPI000C761A4E|nr:hypothetical protein [Bacillus sp. V3-13]PLR75557.1 hypothetical protein CU633_20475 [Bacillus sp. V3-13]